jgi:CelD/BcsL family acetyltransferase involved in cellulose biosynthesis
MQDEQDIHGPRTVAGGSAGNPPAIVHERFEPVRECWDRLAPGCGNVFSTREWAETWWSNFGAGRRLMIVECREGDRTSALIPLFRASERPIRVLRIVGSGHADQLGPVCAQPDRPAAAACLRSVLDGAGKWDLMLAERLGGDEGWPEQLGAPVAIREPSPVLRLETDDWDAFLATRTSNFRQQARRFERRLLREDRLKYRRTNDAKTLERDMETLFDLHRMRWGGEEVSEFLAPATRAFHVEFAHRALERGWLRLWIAELDGRPAAAFYGFRYANAYSFYQGGRDPDFDASSVGFVLMVHTVREAVEDGVSEYNFLVGGEDYKSRFANHDAGLDTVAITRNPAGRAAVRLLRSVQSRPRIGIPMRRLLLS